MGESAKDDGFVAHHRLDSRPWLIKLPQYENMVWQSTSRTAFVTPPTLNFRTVGRRKELLEKFYYQEMLSEMAHELNKPVKIEVYSSEYDGKFADPEFQPRAEKDALNAELHRKYPLYEDAPLSYWLQHRKLIQKTTRAPNSLQLFRRTAGFTKSPGETFDEVDDGSR